MKRTIVNFNYKGQAHVVSRRAALKAKVIEKKLKVRS
jgi:hypothetical protein